MKIIAGRFGGRVLRAPIDRQVRPMSDKVREALFSIMGPVEGLIFLDAYAGSGAIGFEAISRGVVEVVMIERYTPALKIIARNQATLEISGGLNVISSSIDRALRQLASSRFDIIVADPPYDQINATALSGLGQLLRPGGLMVVSHSSRKLPPTLESMQPYDSRSYGDSTLSFYSQLVR